MSGEAAASLSNLTPQTFKWSHPWTLSCDVLWWNYLLFWNTTREQCSCSLLKSCGCQVCLHGVCTEVYSVLSDHIRKPSKTRDVCLFLTRWLFPSGRSAFGKLRLDPPVAEVRSQRELLLQNQHDPLPLGAAVRSERRGITNTSSDSDTFM